MTITIDEPTNQIKNFTNSTQNESTNSNSNFLDNLENSLNEKTDSETTTTTQEQISQNSSYITLMKEEIEQISKDSSYKISQEKINQILLKIKESIENSIKKEFLSSSSPAFAKSIQERVEDLNSKISNITPSNYLEIKSELYSILEDSRDLLESISKNSDNDNDLLSLSNSYYSSVFLKLK